MHPLFGKTVRQDGGSGHAALATGNGTAAEVGDRARSKQLLPYAGASSARQAPAHGLSAEALAHADRVAHAARTLLHNDSDDEPPAGPARLDAAVEPVPFAGTEVAAADSEAAQSQKRTHRAVADAAGTVVNPVHPALTHAARRHDGDGMQNGTLKPELSSVPAGLPEPSSLANSGGVYNNRSGRDAEVIATHPDAMELTLKLSSSSEGPVGTDRAAGSANAAAFASAFGSAVGLTAPSQPPLTLLLTPASSPTQSSAEPGGCAPPAGTATGEPLTLVLSPGSSREQGIAGLPLGAAASDADVKDAAPFQLVLSSSSGQAQHAPAAGGDGHATVQMSASSIPSGVADEQRNSQPPESSADCSAPRSEPALSALGQHSAGQQFATPVQPAEAAMARRRRSHSRVACSDTRSSDPYTRAQRERSWPYNSRPRAEPDSGGESVASGTEDAGTRASVSYPADATHWRRPASRARP